MGAHEDVADAWAHSIQAEQSVLGVLLLDSSAFPGVRGLIDAPDFYTEDHRAIFRAIAFLHGAGKATDLVTVGEHLRLESPERFAACGGHGYLAALAQNAPGISNLKRYAELVRDRAHCRHLDRLAQDLSQAARGRRARDVPELIAETRARLDRLAETAMGDRQLRIADAGDLLNLELPQLELLLGPWLFQKNLVMVHAKRGVGKTHFSLGVAFAIAAGTKFLEYSAPKRRGVLYVDGEMPAQLMQWRLRELASGHGEVPDKLRIITPDLQDRPMPDLATAAGQAEIDGLVTAETELIIIDNLSCLVRSGGAENESESWSAVSEWALKHRRAGRAVIFVHHSGKGGTQRGTSRREDLLDVIINLRRPQEYEEQDGAVFEVHFEKARSLTGDDIAPIQAKLEKLPGGYQWTCTSAATRLQDQIKRLWELDGMTIIDIARELECNKSHVSKTLQKAMAGGELLRPYPSMKRQKATK